MQHKQNSLKRTFSAKGLVLKAAAGFLVAVILPLVGTAPAVFAAGDASFSLSSGGGTKVGNTFTLSVYETSTSSDNVNSEQANLSYPTSKLQYLSTALGTYFNSTNGICGENSGGGGSIRIGCAYKSGSISGKQLIATISFKVLATGSATISMTSGSEIDDTGGANVSNGALPSATYTFSTTTTSGGSSGGTTKKSTPPPSSPTTTKSTTPTTTPTKPTTTPTTTPPTTPVQQPTTTPTAALTITVTDGSGKPVKGAKVVVDSQYSAITDASGKASLSGLSAGSHKVSVAASGKTDSTTTLNLAANENKQVSLKLAAKQSFMPGVYVVVGLLVLGGGAVALLKLRGGGGAHGPQFPVSGIVVGTGNIPGAPTQPTTTVQPTPTGPTPPQVISGAQPPANPDTSDGTTPRVQ